MNYTLIWSVDDFAGTRLSLRDQGDAQSHPRSPGDWHQDLFHILLRCRKQQRHFSRGRTNPRSHLLHIMTIRNLKRLLHCISWPIHRFPIDRRPNTDLSFLKSLVSIWAWEFSHFEVYFGYRFSFYPSSTHRSETLMLRRACFTSIGHCYRYRAPYLEVNFSLLCCLFECWKLFLVPPLTLDC